MENQNTELWFNNFNILFARDNFFEIIPLIDMNFNEKINAITRFCIYLAFILIMASGVYRNVLKIIHNFFSRLRDYQKCFIRCKVSYAKRRGLPNA